MRRLTHFVLAWMVSFALVASPGAWQQCMALHLAAADQVETASGHHHDQTMAHSHHPMGHDHSMNQKPAHPVPPADDHACAKCCSICNVPSALPHAPGTVA